LSTFNETNITKITQLITGALVIFIAKWGIISIHSSLRLIGENWEGGKGGEKGMRGKKLTGKDRLFTGAKCEGRFQCEGWKSGAKRLVTRERKKFGKN